MVNEIISYASNIGFEKSLRLFRYKILEPRYGKWINGYLDSAFDLVFVDESSTKEFKKVQKVLC